MVELICHVFIRNPVDRCRLHISCRGSWRDTQEISLLSKGPKFSLSPGVNEHTITSINVAFCRLTNQIRWKHFRESHPQHSDFLTYPQTRHVYKPESQEELESKLQRIHHELHEPMGSSISGILAILFMDKLETIALSSHLSISPCRRYVDDTEQTCTRDKCPISNTNLCLQRNSVYQITCNNCNEEYIGSTTRFIHDRVREHLNNRKTPP